MWLYWLFLWCCCFDTFGHVRCGPLSVPPQSSRSRTDDLTWAAGQHDLPPPPDSPSAEPSSSQAPSRLPTQTPSLTGDTLSPSASPSTPAPTVSPSTTAPTQLPEAIRQITINMTNDLYLGCLIEDCQNPAWGIDSSENENIFQLCRVLTQVFARCSLIDQQTANMNCSVHSQPTVGGTSLSNQDLHYPESGKSSLSSDQHTDTVASAADTTNNSTVCLEECTDTEAERAMEWCQYSSIYVVFCSGLDGSSKLPGVTLQDMQELVEGRAAACSEAWNQSFWEDDYEDVGDSENSISSHSNGSVGGALSAVLVVLGVAYLLHRKQWWSRQRGQALAGFDDNNSSDFVKSVVDIDTDMETQENNEDDMGSVFVSSAKRKLSLIRKSRSSYSSVSGSVTDSGGGGRGGSTAFGTPFSLSSSKTGSKGIALVHDNEDEEFAEIFL